MKKLKKWQIVIVVLVAFAVIGAIAGGGNGEKSKKVKDDKVSDTKKESTKEENEKSEKTEEETYTTGQKNAIDKADSYLAFQSFSYSGLVKQLEFEGFTNEEAVFAADKCGADWNEQAGKKAKSYLENQSFSRDGLIEQLVFEGFTQEQAEYGATAAGY